MGRQERRLAVHGRGPDIPRTVLQPRRYLVKVARPPSITMVPSWVAVWKTASFPSTHIDTVNVSPGNTGLENRPSIDVNLAGSLPHSVWSSARPVNPYVHRPCRIGRSNPASLANSGSEWSGFRSPESR